MKSMLVFIMGSLYGIVEGPYVEQFKEERDMSHFQTIKLSNKKAHQAALDTGQTYEELAGYNIGEDDTGPYIFPSEELYCFEALDQSLKELSATSRFLIRTMMDDFKLKGEEEAIVFAYLNHIISSVDAGGVEWHDSFGDEYIDMTAYTRMVLRGWGMK